MQELYDEEIIYDCATYKFFSKRYIFLENQEVHIISGWMIAEQDIQSWKIVNDTLIFNSNDSTEVRLVHDSYKGRSYFRSTQNDGFSLKLLREPKYLPQKFEK